MPTGLKRNAAPTPDDRHWMRKALTLAQTASIARTRPNPRVACLLVKNGRLVSEGVHSHAGGPHAEAVALARAGPKARGATAYLTLEPCSHTHKKTPPCAPALIAAGIRRAVIACTDLNPAVNGKGIRMLEKAGIRVKIGILENEARDLNRFFFHWTRTAKPWVILKMATSLDGKITSSRRWLSNPAALRHVQELRQKVDAILVGKRTIQTDNPRLTIRKNGRAINRHEQPLRIILDSRLALDPKKIQVFHNGPVLIACTARAPATRRNAFQIAGIDIWQGPSDAQGRIRLNALLAELGSLGIRSILIEGGSKVATAFLEQRRVNEAYFDVAPLLAGTDAVPLYQGREIILKKATVVPMGDNGLFHASFKAPNTTKKKKPPFSRKPRFVTRL